MEAIYMVLAIIACILLFSFAIFIHEFGHFVAARLLGLRVDRFSIGFGPALWKKKIGDVEYRVSAIPFGGYVALPQLDPEGTDALQGGTDKGEPLKEIEAWKRIVVAFAGPFGNIVLAVVLALLLSVAPGARFGETPPVVALTLPGGEAEKAGLQEGDRVLSIDGEKITAWNDVNTAAALSGGREVEMKVRRGDRELALRFKAAYSKTLGSYMIDAESSCAARVGEVLPDKPAAKAGLKPGDQVVKVNGRTVGAIAEINAEMRRRGAGDTEIVVLRDGKEVALKVSAEIDPAFGRPMLGFKAQVDMTASWMPERGAWAQLRWDAGQIFRVLKGLVTPRESKAVAGALGGPVMIAQVLYRQVRRNFWDALGFLRFVDVNLAILNLLPIPVLDGGLILFALFELVMRRRPPKKLVDSLSMAFMWFFLMLMIVLVWRDVARTRRISLATSRYEDRQRRSERLEQAERDFRPAFELRK